MNELDDTLRMASLDLETKILYRLSRKLGLPTRQEDLGYLTHCVLTGLFDGLAPQPFRVMEEGVDRRSRILAYTQRRSDELAERAQAYAEPDLHAACDWESFATKEMPRHWPEGTRYGFQIRACPVIRKSSAGKHHKKGAEVDAFLSACWDVGSEESVDRESVYRAWLEQRLDGAAKIRKCELERFRLARLVRRRQGGDRKSTILQRPDATLRGELEIQSGNRFQEALTNGIGRHKAFGFGMLMLRPTVGS